MDPAGKGDPLSRLLGPAGLLVLSPGKSLERRDGPWPVITHALHLHVPNNTNLKRHTALAYAPRILVLRGQDRRPR